MSFWNRWASCGLMKFTKPKPLLVPLWEFHGMYNVEKIEATLKSMLLDRVYKDVLAVVKRNVLHGNRHHGLNLPSRSVSCRVWWPCHICHLDFWAQRLLHLPEQHLNDLHNLCGWLPLWAEVEDKLQIRWSFPWRHRCDQDGGEEGDIDAHGPLVPNHA